MIRKSVLIGVLRTDKQKYMFEFIKFKPSLSPYDKILRHALLVFPKSIKPNHLTFFRLLLSPLLIFLLLDGLYWSSLALFVLLALTDMLDGTMARVRNQITDWGKIWDPVADKLLIGCVVATLLLKVNIVLTILLLAFEVMFVFGSAMMKIKVKDFKIKANVWGKIKMNLQCLGVICLILGFMFNTINLVYLAEILLYISLFFAVISLANKGI